MNVAIYCNISIFLSGVSYCIATIDIAIYQYIVILLHPCFIPYHNALRHYFITYKCTYYSVHYDHVIFEKVAIGLFRWAGIFNHKVYLVAYCMVNIILLFIAILRTWKCPSSPTLSFATQAHPDIRTYHVLMHNTKISIDSFCGIQFMLRWQLYLLLWLDHTTIILLTTSWLAVSKLMIYVPSTKLGI